MKLPVQRMSFLHLEKTWLIFNSLTKLFNLAYNLVELSYKRANLNF